MSEDIFRYGGTPGRTNPGALLGLLRALRALDGVRTIQSLHANISSVSGLSDDELTETARLLSGDQPCRNAWVNVGVETASGTLLSAAGGRGKMHPWAPDDWAVTTRNQVCRLTRAGFTPMVSLMMGLPGETPADVDRTCEWVHALDGRRALVYPVFLAPIASGGRPFTMDHMTAGHWRLLEACYRLNFRWNLPTLRREQRCAGVPWVRRTATALFGPLYHIGLKTLFTLES